MMMMMMLIRCSVAICSIYYVCSISRHAICSHERSYKCSSLCAGFSLTVFFVLLVRFVYMFVFQRRRRDSLHKSVLLSWFLLILRRTLAGSAKLTSMPNWSFEYRAHSLFALFCRRRVMWVILHEWFYTNGCGSPGSPTTSGDWGAVQKKADETRYKSTHTRGTSQRLRPKLSGCCGRAFCLDDCARRRLRCSVCCCWYFCFEAFYLDGSGFYSFGSVSKRAARVRVAIVLRSLNTYTNKMRYTLDDCICLFTPYAIAMGTHSVMEVQSHQMKWLLIITIFGKPGARLDRKLLSYYLFIFLTLCTSNHNHRLSIFWKHFLKSSHNRYFGTDLCIVHIFFIIKGSSASLVCFKRYKSNGIRANVFKARMTHD